MTPQRDGVHGPSCTGFGAGAPLARPLSEGQLPAVAEVNRRPVRVRRREELCVAELGASEPGRVPELTGDLGRPGADIEVWVGVVLVARRESIVGAGPVGLGAELDRDVEVLGPQVDGRDGSSPAPAALTSSASTELPSSYPSPRARPDSASISSGSAGSSDASERRSSTTAAASRRLVSGARRTSSPISRTSSAPSTRTRWADRRTRTPAYRTRPGSPRARSRCRAFRPARRSARQPRAAPHAWWRKSAAVV